MLGTVRSMQTQGLHSLCCLKIHPQENTGLAQREKGSQLHSFHFLSAVGKRGLLFPEDFETVPLKEILQVTHRKPAKHKN